MLTAVSGLKEIIKTDLSELESTTYIFLELPDKN